MNRTKYTLENFVLERYLVFAFDQYYPGGGVSDLRTSFKTRQECIDYLKICAVGSCRQKFDDAQIWDTKTGVIEEIEHKDLF